MSLPVQAGQYPSRNFSVGVPSDSVDLPRSVRGFFINTAGDLVVQNFSGDSITFKVLAGQVIALSPKRLMAATTAEVVVLA